MTDVGIGPIDFGDSVARQLEDSGIPFVREPAVHGYRPDFLVQCAPDRKVVFDLNARTAVPWREGHLKYAIR